MLPKKEGSMFWIISTGIFLATLVCTIVFWVIARNNHSNLAGVLAFLSALAGGFGNCIYLCHQDIFRVWHVLLGVVFTVIPMLVLVIAELGEIEGGLPFLMMMTLLIAAPAFLGSMAWDNNYHKAFVEQPDVVEYESYDLIAAQYYSDIHGTLTKYYWRVEGELTEDALFMFYYLADGESGEMKLQTLNASEVLLFFVEEGEQPCWKIVRITKSKVNSKDGKVEEEVIVRNELYVPSGSITPGYDLDVVD